MNYEIMNDLTSYKTFDEVKPKNYKNLDEETRNILVYLGLFLRQSIDCLFLCHALSWMTRIFLEYQKPVIKYSCMENALVISIFL